MTSTTDSVDSAATEWLALADAGDGATSWRAAGAAVRALTSRALAVEQRLDGLPGAPPGSTTCGSTTASPAA